ncbi:MAG: hypothetical protein ACOZNI_04700 [Myxococcota bacterium]
MLFVVAAALAGSSVPEIAVVGLHVPGRAGEAAMEDAARLAEVLDGTGKVDALTPLDAHARFAGREPLVLDGFALGPGRERLKEGRVLYDRAQPDQAIPVLEQAATLLAAGLAQASDANDLHAALMLLGMAHVGMGDEKAAKDAFRRSVILDPARQLDAVNYPPRVIELFESVRKEVVIAKPARVAITATGDADIWIDGRAVGPAPNAEIALVPGEHHVLVRAKDGASWFKSTQVVAGEKLTIQATLAPRTLGPAASEAANMSRQTRELYRSLGEYSKLVVVLAGVNAKGEVALQLYSPASGNFSKAITGDAGDDPVGAMLDLAPAIAGYLDERGDVRADRVSPAVIALDVSTNDVLAGLLHDPPEQAPQVITETRGVPWFVWAGVGVLAAGGGAAAVVLATGGEEEEPPPTDQGTIVFGPIP